MFNWPSALALGVEMIYRDYALIEKKCIGKYFKTYTNTWVWTMKLSQERLGDKSLYAFPNISMQLQAQCDKRYKCLMFMLGGQLCF